MELKLLINIQKLYHYFGNLRYEFNENLLKNTNLLTKVKKTNFFFSKNILSFVNNLNLSKQITGLSLRSYTRLIQLILNLRKSSVIRNLNKFQTLFKIIVLCYLIFIILKKIIKFFFLKISITNFFIDKKKSYYLFFHFPKHSLQKNKTINYPCSLYETVIFKKKIKANFLSFGSYERISRKKPLVKKKLHVQEIHSEFSIAKFFTFVGFFIRNNNKFFNISLPIEINLLNFLNLLDTYYYEVIVKDLENIYNISIKKIFFLGLNNPFPYCYYYSIKSSINEFFYSENFFNPPLYSLRPPYNKKVLSLINFRLWAVTNHAVGFSKNIQDINIVQKKFFSFIKNENFFKKPECKLLPSTLGYENFTYLSGKKNILFFDIKPHLSIKDNLANNAIYDFFSSEYFVSKFNDDVISTLGKTNYKFYLKPKYSLNYKLNENYKKNLKEKLKKYRNFKIIDPYSNLSALSNNVFASISLPFTSIHKIMSNMGVPSKYYCPDDFIYLFTDHCHNKNIIFGKKKLLDWINYQFKLTYT